MTSSNGNISALLTLCAGNSPVIGEFPAQRPVTRSFDVFFDLRLNKRLSKQCWGWWFETSSRPLWRHCNATDTCKRHQALTSQPESSCNSSLPSFYNSGMELGIDYNMPLIWQFLWRFRQKWHPCRQPWYFNGLCEIYRAWKFEYHLWIKCHLPSD